MKPHQMRTLTVAGIALGLLVPAIGAQSTSYGGGSETAALSNIPAPGTIGGPRVGLDFVQTQTWIRGRALFDLDLNSEDGLGSPEYNGDSCRACHQLKAIGGAGDLVLNVSRFGFDNGGAGPFMDLPGGQAASKFYLPEMGGREEYDPTTADVFEQRQTPPLFGDGQIETIGATEILANEDPTDADGDGIFGIARRVNINGVDEVGKFGWKNQIPMLVDFIRDASAGELGRTTPADGRGFGISTDSDGVADPELVQSQLDDMAFFLKNMAPPPRTGSQDPTVLNGEALFSQVGCAKCHIPSLTNKQGVEVPLYSDLLLHNVEPAGFRGMAEDGADVGYYGTPPLWGIKYSAPYMHDGRATTLADAIQNHFGEATKVIAAFNSLDQTDQDDVIAFLNDL